MDLDQVMVDLAARGMTLAQIAARTGLSEAVCYQRMTAKLESGTSVMSTTQLRQLQLRRLEHILDAMWDQVMEGDQYSQGRNTKNLIDAINQISELMDLKRDRLRDEQIRLTQAQTLLVTATIERVRTETLKDVLETLPAEHHEAIRLMWDRSFAGHAASALEENAAARIKMGQGAGELELLPSEEPRQVV